MINGFMVVGLTRENRFLNTAIYGTQQQATESAINMGILPQFSKVLWLTADKGVNITIPVLNVEIT